MVTNPLVYGPHDARSTAWRKPLRGLLLALLACVTLADNAARGEDAGYRLVTIAEDLRWPWSVVRLPADEGFLITEREGRLLWLGEDGTRRPLSGTPDTLFAGQGGYFDVVLHPGFEENRLIYLSFAEGVEDANGTAIFRARLVDGQLRDGERILRVRPDKHTPQHYGGRMLFLADGSLLLTVGEGFEHREQAQSLDSELGKVLRISDDGSVPPGNPYRDEGRERIWSYGHRNPQGLVMAHPQGRVYLHEHGPRGGDELNLVEAGENYGWPAVTHGVDYSGAYVSPFQRAPGMRDPLWTWVPSIAPSGMAWYDAGEFPAWRGSLLIGALVDREVRRLRIENGKVTAEQALFSELGERVRDVRVLDGKLYLLTDSEQGRLIRVVPR